MRLGQLQAPRHLAEQVLAQDARRERGQHRSEFGDGAVAALSAPRIGLIKDPPDLEDDEGHRPLDQLRSASTPCSLTRSAGSGRPEGERLCSSSRRPAARPAARSIASCPARSESRHSSSTPPCPTTRSSSASCSSVNEVPMIPTELASPA